MRALAQLAARLYGERLFHLIVVLAAVAVGAYAISVLGLRNLFNPTVWWQSIAVWFAVAVIGHDLILFPLYALGDRLLRRSRDAPTDGNGASQHPSRRIPLTNYLRMPTLAAGLLLLLPPIFYTIRARQFEMRRWMQSDYPPITRSSSGGGGGDD